MTPAVMTAKPMTAKRMTSGAGWLSQSVIAKRHPERSSHEMCHPSKKVIT
jgi:hypothetical protein